MFDRRNLLKSSAAVAALSLLGPACSPRAAKEPTNRLIVDALGAFFNPNGGPGDGPPSAEDIAASDRRVFLEARETGLSVVNYTIGSVGASDNAYQETVQDLEGWDRRIAVNTDIAMHVKSPADIVEAQKTGKLGVIYGFQDSGMLGDDPSRVQEFADRGARVFQLTYNLANPVGDGAMVEQSDGLTPLGRDMLAAMNEAKIMADLSHSGERTCLDAIELAKRPISISHTGCRALHDLPRNKTDKELRGIAGTGGFVGIYFMPFLAASGIPTIEDVVRHIGHAINICGEDHVGIGTDTFTTLIEDMPSFREGMRNMQQQRFDSGVAATGETLDFLPLVEELSGPDRFSKLADALSAEGHSTGQIDKVLGQNYLAFAQRAWG